jgi:hypothetical protein
MKISHSKRFDRMTEIIARGNAAARIGDLNGLIYLIGHEYGPLIEAIEADFEKLSAEHSAISEQVSAFQNAGDDLAGLVTQLHKSL